MRLYHLSIYRVIRVKSWLHITLLSSPCHDYGYQLETQTDHTEWNNWRVFNLNTDNKAIFRKQHKLYIDHVTWEYCMNVTSAASWTHCHYDNCEKLNRDTQTLQVSHNIYHPWQDTFPLPSEPFRDWAFTYQGKVNKLLHYYYNYLVIIYVEKIFILHKTCSTILIVCNFSKEIFKIFFHFRLNVGWNIDIV